VKLGHVAIDTTKMAANASKHKAMSYRRMAEAESKLQQQVDRLLAEAERIDAQKDAQYGMSSHTRKRGFLTDGARKRAGRRTPGEDHLAAEKIEGHGASTLLALG